MPGPSEWLEPVTAVLGHLGLRWAVMGALAANEHRATPRLTTDLDLLAEAHAELPDALRAAGYEVATVADPDEPPHLLRLRRAEQQIDVLHPVVEYQKQALDRAREGVLTIEDVLVHKLLAWRPRDRDDVRSILEAEGAFDEDYVRRWASEWDVADRWQESQVWRAG